MKLADWLADSKVSDADFASRIGVSRQAVGRYAKDQRIPKRKVLERIAEETGGAVRASDFYDEAAA